MTKLTDEQIEQIYYEACREFANALGLRAVADAAVQAAMECKEPVAWIQTGLIEADDELVWKKRSVGHYTPLYTTPLAAPLPEVIATLDSVLAQLDGGFIRCENCGDQQDTKDMDVVSYLKEARAMLVASKQENI